MVLIISNWAGALRLSDFEITHSIVLHSVQLLLLLLLLLLKVFVETYIEFYQWEQGGVQC